MAVSNTCKMLGIVLDEKVAQESYRIITEAIQEKACGIPGEIRNNTESSFKPGMSSNEYYLSLLVKFPPEFVITGVELINSKQLQFDVTWYIDLSEEAINQLYIVPCYLTNDMERKLFAMYAKIG